MKFWVPITQEHFERVFNSRELETLKSQASADVIKDELADMVARVREAVAQNRSNALSADKMLIPRSLRGAALDILALRLLKRYALAVTDERKAQAERAEELLQAIAAGKRLVLDEQGNLPTDPAAKPAIIAPRPAYGNDGVGMWPTP